MIESRHELGAMMRLGAGYEVETIHDRLRALIRRPSWQAQAACRGVGPDVFFPARGGSVAPAKALCDSCPVSAPCLAHAAEVDAEGGIWGGVSARKIHSGGKRAA